MKCSTCNDDECKGVHESSNKMTDLANYLGIYKVKDIQISDESKVKAGVLFCGIGTVAAGATVVTLGSGLIPIVAGSTLLGVGYPLIISPIVKYFKDEPISTEELKNDMALGATIGAATGPIGYGGAELSKLASSGVSKFAIRTAFSSVAGAASRAVPLYLRGGITSTVSNIKSIGQGAIFGSIGGTTSHLLGGFPPILRIVGQGGTAAATDAGLQYQEKGEIDIKQSAMTAGAQMIFATTAETTSSIAQKTQTYNNKLNSELIDDKVKSGQLTASEGQDRKQQMNDINRDLPSDLKSEKRYGQYKAHKLYDRSSGNRENQVAFNTEGKDSGARAIAEKINDRYVYVDETRDHNYRACMDTNKGKLPNPIEPLKSTKVGLLMKKSDDMEDDTLSASEETINEKEKRHVTFSRKVEVRIISDDGEDNTKQKTLNDYASIFRNYVKSKL